MKKPIIVYGNGTHGELVYALFKEDDYNIVAFTVERKYLKETSKFDLPVIPFEEVEQHYSPKNYDMFVAIGPHQLNTVREKFYNLAKEKGYSLPTFKSSSARIPSDFVYGENCWIDNSSNSHPYVQLGNNTIIQCSNLGHHTRVGNHCFIAASTVGGNVIIEDNVFIGVGSYIKSGVKIGKGSIIGMGIIITKDVAPYSVYSKPSDKPREGIDSRDISLF